MNYVLKRKLSVYGTIFLIIAIFAYWGYDKYIKEKPTCFDNIKNGVEEGIDCGGSCERICVFKAEKVNINWTRAFEVTSGIYNVASSLENPNFNYGYNIDYTIKYLNDKGITVGEIKNKVYLEPLAKKILFFPGIQLPGQSLKRIFLKVNRIYDLERVGSVDNKLTVNSKELIREKDLTKLKVIIQNDDILPQRNIQITAVLFDKDGNSIDINRTYIDYLDKVARGEAYMTWPREFEEEIAEIKIYLDKIDF